MADPDENTIRTALTDQLTRCEARCARCEAELKSVTAAMQQSDAANVALAIKLESALAADVRAEARKVFAREVEALLRKHLQHGGDKVWTHLAIVEIDALVRAELEP